VSRFLPAARSVYPPRRAAVAEDDEPEDFDATVAFDERLRDDCRANTEPVGIGVHLDSGRTVHDLEAVRVALGERKLTFHAGSFGTVLGAQYAERYPRNVRAMVLESVMDHSVPTTRALVT
jgi:pimeloyl-ACP methyl ester carboxylesterase